MRNLVNFVRKRDRRVQAYRRVLEERAEANRVKQEEKRREQLRKRQEELAAVRENKVFNEGYEEQLKQLAQQYGSDSDEYTDADDDDDEGDEDSGDESDPDAEELEVEYVDDLYCVACNKTFKNAKARANHEESKKHRENVERLRQEMEAEEEAFKVDASHEDSLSGVEEALDDVHITDDHLSGDEAPSEEESTQTKRSKKNKKSKKAAAKQVQEEASDGPDEPIDLKATTKSESEDDDWSRGKKAAKKSKSKKTTSTNKAKPAEQVAPESAPKETRAVPATAAKSGDEALDATTAQHTCVTCRLVFDSKNKLFAHLKKTNHGVYIPKAKPDVEGKPPGKAKGKRNK